VQKNFCAIIRQSGVTSILCREKKEIKREKNSEEKEGRVSQTGRRKKMPAVNTRSLEGNGSSLHIRNKDLSKKKGMGI